MTAQADAQWKLLGSIAMAHGLEWGGSWGWDMPHVQLKNWKVLSRGQ